MAKVIDGVLTCEPRNTSNVDKVRPLLEDAFLLARTPEMKKCVNSIKSLLDGTLSPNITAYGIERSREWVEEDLRKYQRLLKQSAAVWPAFCATELYLLNQFPKMQKLIMSHWTTRHSERYWDAIENQEEMDEQVRSSDYVSDDLFF